MRGGIYLQIYQTKLSGNASRMIKIATSIFGSGLFDEAHMVGVLADDVSPEEMVAPGVFITRLRGSARRGNVGRILRLVLWQPKVFLRYRSQPITVVAAHNIWVLPLSWVLSVATKAKLVYNAHELETETIAIHGLKKVAAKLIERVLIGRCQIVSVVNPYIADWYRNTYRGCDPIVVGNIPVVRSFDAGLRARIGVPADQMLYIHTGNLSKGRNIPAILSAFAESEHHVLFMGNGIYRDAVLESRERHPNIHWIEPVPLDQIVAHVREADVGLCLIELERDLSYQLSSPNKLMESLAAGIPPLCTDMIVARGLLGANAEQWIVRDPHAELGAALDRITKDDCERFRAEFAGIGTWDQQVQPLIEAYERLVG